MLFGFIFICHINTLHHFKGGAVFFCSEELSTVAGQPY
jgi:hypothetical protein